MPRFCDLLLRTDESWSRMTFPRWFRPCASSFGAVGVAAPILFVPDSLPIGSVIEELLLLDECAVDEDWAAGVLYLPLR